MKEKMVECNGEGCEEGHIYVMTGLSYDGDVTEHIEDCPVCEGTGEVRMNWEEYAENHEDAIIRKAIEQGFYTMKQWEEEGNYDLMDLLEKVGEV